MIAGASAALLLAAGLFLALERPTWLAAVADAEPVLVIVVGDRSRVALMREAVDPARIVADSPDAIALAEGRLFAADAVAVSDSLERAGWTDRKIEIFTVSKSGDSQRRGGSGAERGERDPRMERLMELMNKPRLSRGEALFVLSAMNDGLM